MSLASFQAFCVEQYASHSHSTGAEVYRRFTDSGLLKVLHDDYEDLHGLGWEALMPMFDQYLGVVKTDGPMNDHALIRSTLVTAIVGILAAHWHIGEDEAMRRFYMSNTAKALADDETGLYGMSALNIAGDCLAEVGESFLN